MSERDTTLPSRCSLSLILTTYNAGAFIGQSIDSVLRVVPADGSVELLVVDDGSTDDTPAILAEYGNRIRLFTIANVGLSAARNLALGHVRGDYIGFIDADDYWTDVRWEDLLALLQKGADIIEFDTDVVDNRDRVTEHFHVTCAEPGALVPVTEKLLNRVCYIRQWFVWTRFYRREAWGERRFPPGMIYEDMLTLPFVYQNAKTVLCADFVLVHYRFVPNSLSRGISPKRVSSLLWGIGHFRQASTSSNDFFANCVRSCYEMLLRTAARLPDEALGQDFFAAIDRQRRTMWQLLLTTRIRFILCFLFPTLCFDYFRWRHERHQQRPPQTQAG